MALFPTAISPLPIQRSQRLTPVTQDGRLPPRIQCMTTHRATGSRGSFQGYQAASLCKVVMWRDCSPCLTVLEESRAGACKPPASTPDPRKSSRPQGPSAHFSPSPASEGFVLSRVPGKPPLAPFPKAARGRECEGIVGGAPQEGLARHWARERRGLPAWSCPAASQRCRCSDNRRKAPAAQTSDA